MRGHSVTFAVLFAFALLGVSVVGVLRSGLGALGAPWLLILVIPALAVGALARKERDWIPEEKTRKTWARSIVAAAVLLAFVLARFNASSSQGPTAASENGDARAPAVLKPRAIRPHGPSGK
jgi:hypothetical protein